MSKSAAPKRPDYNGAGFEKSHNVFTKCIWLFTFNVNRANHILTCPVEHGNNDLRPRRSKGREIPWIGRDIPDIHCFPGGNGSASQPLGDGKRRILRRTRPAPDDVRHGSSDAVHIIKPDPAIAPGTPKKFSDAFKSGNPVPRG